MVDCYFVVSFHGVWITYGNNFLYQLINSKEEKAPYLQSLLLPYCIFFPFSLFPLVGHHRACTCLFWVFLSLPHPIVHFYLLCLWMLQNSDFSSLSILICHALVWIKFIYTLQEDDVEVGRKVIYNPSCHILAKNNNIVSNIEPNLCFFSLFDLYIFTFFLHTECCL